jgi:hypothetical protein
MTFDLTQDEQLRKAALSINPRERSAEWIQNLESFLKYVSNTELETRKGKEFQERLWEHNAVSSVGMGTVDIGAAIDDPEFRAWFAEESVKPLGESTETRIAQLRVLRDELAERLKAYSKRSFPTIVTAR